MTKEQAIVFFNRLQANTPLTEAERNEAYVALRKLSSLVEPPVVEPKKEPATQ